MPFASNEYKQVIKADLALPDNTTARTDAFSIPKTNGRCLIRIYWNDTDGTLAMGTGTLSFQLTDTNNNALGMTIMSYTGGIDFDGTTFKKGDLLAEYIVPPSVEDEGTIKVQATTGESSGISTKKVSVQYSMIM